MPSATPSSAVFPAGAAPDRPLALRSAGALLLAALVLVLAGTLVHAFAFDRPWMLWVHAREAGPAAAIAWSSLTVSGLGWSAVILLLASERRGGTLSALLLPCLLLGGLLTQIPKHLLAFPRPAGTDIAPQLHVIGHAFTGAVSMPSGHSLTAAAAAGLLCAVLARTWTTRCAILLLAALVAWSRLAVGAHWPSDVLVGAGLGFAAAGLAIAVAAWPRSAGWHRRLAARIATPAGQRWIAAAELGTAAGLLSENTGYPAGVPMVWLLVALAVVSAALRWWATLQPSAPQQPRDARAGLL